MRRFCLLFAVLALLVSAAPARAGGGHHRDGHALQRVHGERLAIVPTGLAGAALLTEWWRTPLSLPAEDEANPFNSGGCRMVGPALALAYGEQCTVPRGTWIFVVAMTVECSNVEPGQYHADTPLEAALCGLRNDRRVSVATFALDGGEEVSLLDWRFGTFMLPGRVVVPENGVFGGTPGEIMRYGGHGYVAFIRPLPVGEHTLHGHVEDTIEGPQVSDFDTTITVTR